jgi:hypothetical protein
MPSSTSENYKGETMIITDLNGGTLELSKTKLTEVTGESVPGTLWFLPLKSLLEPINKWGLKIFNRMEDGPAWGWAGFEAGRIGCRAFDAATFKKIMAAAQRTTKAKPVAAKKKGKGGKR